MAATLVGGALLSASFSVLLDRLSSPELINFFRGRKHDERLLKKLKLKLLGLNKVLDDAEDKQITNRAVNEWLDELKDAVYHAEDLVDEIATEALRCKVEAGYQIGPNQAKTATFQCPYLVFKFRSLEVGQPVMNCTLEACTSYAEKEVHPSLWLLITFRNKQDMLPSPLLPEDSRMKENENSRLESEKVHRKENFIWACLWASTLTTQSLRPRDSVSITGRYLIAHNSPSCYGIFVDEKIRSGELRLQGNVGANPFPGHKGFLLRVMCRS